MPVRSLPASSAPVAAFPSGQRVGDKVLREDKTSHLIGHRRQAAAGAGR